jgi:hypothetical protein
MSSWAHARALTLEHLCSSEQIKQIMCLQAAELRLHHPLKPKILRLWPEPRATFREHLAHAVARPVWEDTHFRT